MQTGKSQKVALPKMEQLQKIQKVSESYQSQLEVQPLSQEPMFFRIFRGESTYTHHQPIQP